MLVQVFVLGFVFSFIGSIPPGTLNVIVLQLGIENKIKTAMRFALAVAIIEYPYAWISVVFENLITSSPEITKNFQLIGAVVMTTVGAIMVISAQKPSQISVRLGNSGFVRGLILSILNPQAIPFWIVVTAYLKAEGWVVLDTPLLIHSYVLGTAIGVLVLLTLLAYGGRKVSFAFQSSKFVKMIPGLVLLVLGIYGLLKILLSS